MIQQTDPKKRGRASKRKGANAENELVRLLNETYGCHTRRGHVYYGEPDVIGLDGLHIEVKRVERLNVVSAMEQAKAESKKKHTGIPAVFHRRDRGEWLVTMQLKNFMPLYRAWAALQEMKGVQNNGCE